MDTIPGLEFRIVELRWMYPLTELFEALVASGDDFNFHPHPMTFEEARRVCRYCGKDLYYVAVRGVSVLAYGLLRGWDDGFEVPSLGIAVHPAVRGRGLGTAFMEFLHGAARLRGAKSVRLRVHRENLVAIRLYERLGYEFQEKEEDGQRVGILKELI